METPAIENPKPDTNKVEVSSSFLLHNGYNNNKNSNPCINQIADIELISIQSVSYTSLKDLLPASPPTITSPTNLHNSSYHAIPIRNHLVKQAALAYLQPMCSPPEVGDKGFSTRFKDFICCSSECGCLSWFNDGVYRSFRDAFWFSKRRNEIHDCDYDEDEDDDEDDEKVD